VQIELRRGNGQPVYRQIAEAVRDALGSGQLAAGEKLPPIRELARRLGVNRDTVALAYEELAGQGLVESAVGRGTFVAAEAASPHLPALPEPALSPLVERLLDYERGRPRFAAGPDTVAMHALVPAVDLYPAEDFRRALNRALAKGGPELLVYGPPQGHPGLRGILAERLGRAGVRADPEELVLCHGASQGIGLAVRLLAAPGDAVAVEEPTYGNVLATLLSLGIRPVPVPMGTEGPELAALARVLARPEVKLFYTIPTFHNPMGITTGAAHRRELLRVAAAAGKPVVEDAFEMDLVEGRPAPPLAALDAHGLVVHLFSFSKSLFPGTRVGSILARGRLQEAVLALKRASDLSDAMPLQAALAEFVAAGAYDRHLASLRRILASRRRALLEALDEHMPAGTRWTRPAGGYQLWVELPEGIDTADLLADAVRSGVLFAPGYQFTCDGRPSNALRLTVATADEAALHRGVGILGRLVRERLEARPRLGALTDIHV